MPTVRLGDVIAPDQFTKYVMEHSIEKTALVESGIVVNNAEMSAQLHAGADSFHTPFWKDLGNEEANLVSDDPAQHAVPRKITAGKQIVRKGNAE